MIKNIEKKSWIIIGVLSTIIGLYPIVYFLIDINSGKLPTKSEELLNSNLWNIGFYGHIFLAGISLLIGWLQFSNKLRIKNVKLHRTIGKIYVVSVLISGFFSLFISLYATGGIISTVGFFSLGLVWLSTTILGFLAIKKGNVELHEKFMIFSFACAFAAVTLRVWLPILTELMGDFIIAYRTVAWFCWIPNLIVAYLIIKKKELH